jgi:hypothetical protein
MVGNLSGNVSLETQVELGELGERQVSEEVHAELGVLVLGVPVVDVDLVVLPGYKTKRERSER